MRARVRFKTWKGGEYNVNSHDDLQTSNFWTFIERVVILQNSAQTAQNAKISFKSQNTKKHPNNKLKSAVLMFVKFKVNFFGDVTGTLSRKMGSV